MERKSAAKTLREIGRLLEIAGENPHRVRAFTVAARAVERRGRAWSCGGPCMCRNKAASLHVDSVGTSKVAEDIAEEKKTDNHGQKRKLSQEEMTQKIADSCASSHSSLGSGILPAVQTGTMNLLKER